MIAFALDYLVPVLAILAVLITIHELGHYAAARAFGVRVATFAVGFGPRLLGRVSRSSGTDWCLRAIPLGGYVKFGDEETGGRALDGVALTALKRWQRIVILVAGPAVNLLFVPVAFYGFLMIQGVSVIPAQVEGVLPDSPAAEAGLQVGDTLIAVEGRSVDGLNALVERVRIGLDAPVQTTWETAAGVREITLTPEVRSVELLGRTSELGVVGVVLPAPVQQDLGALAAVPRAVQMSWEHTGQVMLALSQIVTGQRGVDELMGVVGMGHMSGEMTKNHGIAGFLYLLGLISLSLGIVNLLPVPVMDGGQICVLLWEGVTGKDVTPEAEAVLVRIGIGVVGILLLVTLWNDVSAIVNVIQSA